MVASEIVKLDYITYDYDGKGQVVLFHGCLFIISMYQFNFKCAVSSSGIGIEFLPGFSSALLAKRFIFYTLNLTLDKQVVWSSSDYIANV